MLCFDSCDVYVKTCLQYYGGIVFASAVNNPTKVANTIMSFLVFCLAGGRKCLCPMVPVKELGASFFRLVFC